MNTIVSFLIEVALTLLVSSLLVRYLRPFLQKILTDLCGTEDRAQFWLAFSNILLIGMPALFALSYSPQATKAEELVFDLAGKLSGNLAAFLFAMIGVGFVVSFFALFAPRASQAEAK